MSTVESKTTRPSRDTSPRRSTSTSSNQKTANKTKTGTTQKARQKATVQRQNPSEKSAISKEAREPKAVAPNKVPNFQKSFGTAHSKDSDKAGEDASRAAQQARVVAGQTNNHILRGSPGPTVGQGVRLVGGAGGAGSVALAGKNFKNALDSNRSAGERTLQGVSGVANTAHGIHGLSQGADYLRKAANLPTLNAGPKGDPVGLRQVPGHLAQNVRDIKANGLKDTLQKGVKGLFTANGPASGLEKAGALARWSSTVAQTAGKVAPALGGVTQVASGVTDAVQNGLSLNNAATTISGGAKLVGAGLIASGVGAPIGAGLIAASTAYDLGKLAWDNKGAIADFAKSTGSAALSGLSTAGRAALGAIPGGSALLGGIGRLFG